MPRSDGPRLGASSGRVAAGDAAAARILRAGVADASQHRRCIGARSRSSDAICSDPIWEA
eukprot:8313333-Pyramimonas_sp.AAC.1